MNEAKKTEELESATFTRMVDGKPEEWAIVFRHSAPFQARLADRVLDHLRLLGGDSGGYAVDRLEHSLQTATRAERDGRDEEYVVCALLHDIGDTLGCFNHSEIAAAVLKPFVSEKNHWIVEQHGIFQGYYFFEHMGLDKNMRDRFRDHPWFADAAQFCAKYDQNSFDPKYDTLPLEHFEPMVRGVISVPRRSIYVSPEKPRAFGET
jgi:predicted HD phosphohydrolase